MQVMVYEGPKKISLAEVAVPALSAGEARVKTLYSGISHGTEMNVYRGNAPFFREQMDWDRRIMRPAAGTEVWQYPIRSCDDGVWYMGYQNVGTVTEIAADVTQVKVGDIVYAPKPHQSEYTINAADLAVLPKSVPPEYGVICNILNTAYNGILDARIKLGDTVVVSGLGVLGQLCVQMAKMSGALRVIGIDVCDNRLAVAKENGADYMINSAKADDVAYEVKNLTDLRGPDVVIEASGNTKALNEAIRMAAFNGFVVALGWYQKDCSDINLAGEFHHNRVTIRGSHTSEMAPDFTNTYTNARRAETCMRILERLKLDNIITHTVDYADIATAYETVDQHPEDVIQVVLKY